MSREITMPSGLILVETVDKPIDQPPEPIDREQIFCVDCGRISEYRGIILGWKTSDGFDIEWPTCGHGKFATCSDCEALMKCPMCGCGQFYT